MKRLYLQYLAFLLLLVENPIETEMQAVGTKNRTSLHSIDGSAFKTRGSLSIGRGVTFVREEGGHFPSEFPAS